MCCVLRFAENSDGGFAQVDPHPACPPFPSGLTASLCFSLSRMRSRSPGASPWAATWALTASPTSWSASQSLRASASTSSVWVSVSRPGQGQPQAGDRGGPSGRWALLPWPPVELQRDLPGRATRWGFSMGFWLVPLPESGTESEPRPDSELVALRINGIGRVKVLCKRSLYVVCLLKTHGLLFLLCV